MCAMNEVAGAYDRVGHFIVPINYRDCANSLRDYFERSTSQRY